jgi:uncharacterized membrane protein
MIEALYALAFFLAPAAVLYLVHHQGWARKLGIVLVCYLSGLLLGNLGLFPPVAAPVQSMMSEVTVALALPMLLFSLDISRWRKMAGPALLSMLFAITSVVTVATALYYLLPVDDAQTGSHLAAMTVGIYTGGTPNLAAIKTALEIPHSLYIGFHSLDSLFGGAYILFMLSLGIPLFRRLLGRPVVQQADTAAVAPIVDEEDYRPFFALHSLPQLGGITALAALVLALSLGLSQLAQAWFGLGNTSALTIVLLTLFGMALSFIPRVRALELSYRAGMYLVYVFCFAVATLSTLDELSRVSPLVVTFLFGGLLGSLLLHLLLCKLARVDGDTFVITSVAAVCSPPFVPLFAKALGNPAMLLSGMTTGIIGYALGNFLGISLALMLQS